MIAHVRRETYFTSPWGHKQTRRGRKNGTRMTWISLMSTDKKGILAAFIRENPRHPRSISYRPIPAAASTVSSCPPSRRSCSSGALSASTRVN